MDQPIKILFAGEGGQGVQTIAKILTKAAFLSGRKTTYLPNYGVEQRGGVSLAFVQICECEGKHKTCDCDIGFPKFNKADILVNLRERAIERTKRYVKKEALYIYDSSLVSRESLAGISSPKIAVPAAEYAKKKLDPKVFNMIILGAVISYTDVVNKKHIYRAIDDVFKEKIKKKPELKHLNHQAFDIGYKLMKNIENAGVRSGEVANV